MKKNRKETKGLLLGILLLVIAGLSSYTYSRYISSITAEAEVSIAKWAVKLNGSDMHATNTLTVTATDTANDYVTSGKIAPGKNIKFNFELDPTGSEVAIDYIFEVPSIPGLTGSEISITSVTAQIGDETLNAISPNASNKYMVTESLADVKANKKVNIEVTVTWTNNEEKNSSDTAYGVTAPTATINVPITAQQHIG